MKNKFFKPIIVLFFAFGIGNAQNRVPLIRYYSHSTLKHFYSTKNDAPPGYFSEGVLLYVYDGPFNSFTNAIYLLYNSKGDRLMTTSVTEKNNALSLLGYQDGGIVGYTNLSPSLTTIYRYYNSKKPDHFYTNTYNELGGGGAGYRYEGALLW